MFPVWPTSESNMDNLLHEQLDTQTVPMHLDGVSFAYTTDGKRHIIPDGQAGMYAACGDGAIRVRGGASTLVKQMLNVEANPRRLSIHLGMEVTQIDYHDEEVVTIKCMKKAAGTMKDRDNDLATFSCRAVVLAAPPRVLANTIDFLPPLPKQKIDGMLATPTWMQDYGKVAISFPVNWWRQNKMSGISIDHVGAVATWWEACSGNDGDGTFPILAGFVTAEGADILNDIIRSSDGCLGLYEYIIQSLGRVYGIEESAMGMKKEGAAGKEGIVTTQGTSDKDGLVITNGLITVSYKSWLEDSLTNAKDDRCSKLGFTCDYGDRDLQQSVGPLFFAGTETATGHGHMEGAVIAAKRVCAEVMEYLAN